MEEDMTNMIFDPAGHSPVTSRIGLGLSFESTISCQQANDLADQFDQSSADISVESAVQLFGHLVNCELEDCSLKHSRPDESAEQTSLIGRVTALIREKGNPAIRGV